MCFLCFPGEWGVLAMCEGQSLQVVPCMEDRSISCCCVYHIAIILQQAKINSW